LFTYGYFSEKSSTVLRVSHPAQLTAQHEGNSIKTVKLLVSQSKAYWGNFAERTDLCCAVNACSMARKIRTPAEG